MTAVVELQHMTGAGMRHMTAGLIRRLCRIQKPTTVTKLAKRHRILPESSSNPGPYDPSVVPFARRPQDLMGDPSVELVVLCWAVQTTKSTNIENALMYRIARSPSPMLVVQPKIELAESWAKERFRPMVRATPLLRRLVRMDRQSESTLRYYKFPGGFLFIASAQSASELSGRSAPFVFFDEVDRMEVIPGEGSPVELGLKRQAGGDIGLAVLTSTPRDADTTIIWPYLEGGTFELYEVPCPHCDHRQPLFWKQLRWDRNNPRHAYYVCRGAEDKGCGSVVEEHFKREMLAAGEWNPTNPEAHYPSLHLNGLYSPFGRSSWGVLAQEWDRAYGKPADLQVFVNTRLAELYEDTTDLSDPNSLVNRLEPELSEGVVPRGVGLLTVGVDVQGNRLEVCVWGWGAGIESWLVSWIVIPGDPEREPNQPGSVWAQLDEILAQQFAHEDSGGIPCVPITITFVDSGYAATKVYRYTNLRKGNKVFASKGVGGAGIPIVGKPSLVGDERAILYGIGTDTFKSEFIRSQLPEPKRGPGYVHLPLWMTKDQCAQLVSEKRKRKLQKGKIIWEWKKKTEDTPNEGLDARGMARAALESLGTKTIVALGDMADQFTAYAKTVAEQGRAPTPAVAGSGSRMLSRGLPRDD